MTLRVSGIVEDSIVDGSGLRLAVFFQGCYHHCEGCHNPESHSPDGGCEMSTSEILAKVARNPLCKGITLTGGEPLLQPQACIDLAKGCEGLGKDVWLFSGYTHEEIIDRPELKTVLEDVDVLVDGKYDQAQRTLGSGFKGSMNQRIIYLKGV